MAGLTVHAAELAKLEVQVGADWLDLPGASSYRETGGDAPERDVPAFRGVAKRSGHPRVPSVEVAAVYPPAHRSWRQAKKDSITRKTRRFRFTTKEDEILVVPAVGTVAIAAATGLLTFAGTPKPNFASGEFAPGMILTVGGKVYVIDSFDEDGTNVVVVDASDLNNLVFPANAVAAASDYKLIIPALRKEYPASIVSAGVGELDNEGNLNTSLRLSPKTQLPDWDFAASY